jgi:5'-3' exonuclease
MRLLLVDGSNLLIRALMATERSPMSHQGMDTGALLVFINTLSGHIREEKPTHVVIAWDGPGFRWRQGVDPEYKAHRPAVVDGQEAQEFNDRKSDAFTMAQAFCATAGLMQIQRRGFEGDDIIAAYWRRYRHDADVIILSSDKDFMQLLTDGTEQVRLSSYGTPTDRWDEARVVEHFGCPVEWIPRVMALMGDAGDNVIGIKGIGPKKAVKILHAANGDLDSIEDERVSEHKARVSTNLRLVDLRSPLDGLVLPDPPPFDPTKLGSALQEELVQFLTSFNLKSILTRVYAGSLWSDGVHLTDN